MKQMLRAIVVVILTIVELSAGKQAAVREEPLTPEQQAVYSAFMASALKQIQKVAGRKETIHLQNKTKTLYPTYFPNEREEQMTKVEQGCWQLVGKTPFQTALVHRLTGFKGLPSGVKIDRGSRGQVLSLSEIVFDDARHRALFRFDFTCGNICGLSGTKVFERSNAGWVEIRDCGGFIS